MNTAIPKMKIIILIHCEVDKINTPLNKSPLKNSSVNLTILYKIQYNPKVLYVPTYFLYVKANIMNMQKLQIDSIICIGNNGMLFGAIGEL